MADPIGYRTIADRNEVLKQDYTGRPREVALSRYLDYLAGIEQQAIGNNIVRNTPKDIAFEALRQRYPGMTRGIPLDELGRVNSAIRHDEGNVARDTDARPWDPRDFPDPGLAYRHKSLQRQHEDARAPLSISNAPRGLDPVRPGVTMNYQPTPQAKALGNVIAALQDERLGMVPGLGAIRGLGGLRGRLFQPRHEWGGFNVPTSQMRRDMGVPRPNHPKMEVPSTEKALRDDYTGTVKSLNEIAKEMRGPGILHEADLDRLRPPTLAEFKANADPRLAALVERAVIGQNLLHTDTRLRPFTTAGMEGPPSDYMLRRFGFKPN